MGGVAMKARRRKTTSLKRSKHPIAARGGGSSPVNLQKQLEKRTRELAESQQHLAEALEQHTATSKILSAVARSSTDVQVVLDAICESARHGSVRLTTRPFGVRMATGSSSSLIMVRSPKSNLCRWFAGQLRVERFSKSGRCILLTCIPRRTNFL